MEKTELYQLCLEAEEASKRAKRNRQNMARHLTALLARVAKAKEDLVTLEAQEVASRAAEKAAWANYREATHA